MPRRHHNLNTSTQVCLNLFCFKELQRGPFDSCKPALRHTFASYRCERKRKMPLVCKTLVLIENAETLKIVAEAFPHPKYELEFVDSVEEATAHAFSNRLDLFVVDSKSASDEKVISIKRYMPTLVVEPEYVRVGGGEYDNYEEVDRIRNAAQKLLRKNYINWIIDVLEYSS